MNVVVIGNGSIGKRHSKNLKNLGLNVRAVDVDEINNINEIIKNGDFDFGVVCTPTNLHLQHCLILAEHNLDFFCEKPFYSKKDLFLFENLCKLVKQKSLINMVGCNLRFDKTIKDFDFSDTTHIKVFFGYDLKKWHNDGKHLEMYSANKSMGGGVLLDVIHEFDYLYHWFGKIKKVEGIKKRKGNVTVDTEDTVDAEIFFENGVKADVHLDYLQPNYTRYFKKVLDWGAEMKYFINNVKKRKKCMNDINEATYLIEKLIKGIK